MSNSNELARWTRCGVVAFLAGITVACDGPIGPGTIDLTPAALSVPSTDAIPLQIVNVGVRGVTLSTTTLDGTFAGQAIKGARIDDTTIAVVVQQVAPGSHALRFDIGTMSFTGTLKVRAAVPVADPTAYFDGVLATLTTQAAQIDAVLAGTPSSALASDTAGLREIAGKLRWAADSGRKLVTAMSASERATAAAYLTANATIFTPASQPAPQLGMLAGDPCAEFRTSECAAQVDAAWEALVAQIRGCTAAAINGVALGGSVGMVIGGGLFSVPTAAIGMVLGGTGAAAYCVYKIQTQAMETVVEPVITNLEEAAHLNRIPAFNAGAATSIYQVGAPKLVAVTGEFRSLQASDATRPGVGAIIAKINEAGSLWAKLGQLTGLSVPAPAVPAVARFSTRRALPASQLALGKISLAGATASKGGNDTLVVTFANEKQGQDHDVSYAVQYAPAGVAVQERMLSGTLRPARYSVMTVKVDSAPGQLVVGQSGAIVWQAQDSAGKALTDPLLLGRKPQWTSDKPGVATVSDAGVITAVDTGTVVVTGRLEQGVAIISLRVYPSVIGNWVMFNFNGSPLPWIENDSTGQTKVTGGNINILSNGTFTFGYAETYTNKFTNITYDEGASGSGTYVANGNGVIFTILEKSSEKVQEFVGAGIVDGVMTVTYSGPDGSGTGKLKR